MRCIWTLAALTATLVMTVGAYQFGAAQEVVVEHHRGHRDQKDERNRADVAQALPSRGALAIYERRG